MEALNQTLASELLQMADIDQGMRIRAGKGEAEWDDSVDTANQSRLASIIDADGWPTLSKVGPEASNAAWLLAQHAPDLQFMERCLELMESLAKNEVRPANVAYLKDRVLTLNGRPQLYGTQFQGTGDDMKVCPIENPDRVEERRASVGLGTLAENEARVREVYRSDKSSTNI